MHFPKILWCAVVCLCWSCDKKAKPAQKPAKVESYQSWMSSKTVQITAELKIWEQTSPSQRDVDRREDLLSRHHWTLQQYLDSLDWILKNPTYARDYYTAVSKTIEKAHPDSLARKGKI